MGLTPDDKRDLDRDRARKWLAGRGKDHGSPERALRLVLNIKPETPLQAGMSGTTQRLTSVGGSKAEFLALGIAGVLVGENLLRPVKAAAQHDQKKQRRGRPGPQLGPCTLTRLGYALLVRAGHPKAATDPAPTPRPRELSPFRILIEQRD